MSLDVGKLRCRIVQIPLYMLIKRRHIKYTFFINLINSCIWITSLFLYNDNVVEWHEDYLGLQPNHQGLTDQSCYSESQVKKILMETQNCLSTCTYPYFKMKYQTKSKHYKRQTTFLTNNLLWFTKHLLLGITHLHVL